jgi:hypothetical protein
MTIEIIDVRAGETEEQAEARAKAEKPAPTMPADEYRRRVLEAVAGVLDGSGAAREELDRLTDWSVARDFPSEPPQVCACGRPFRGLIGNEAQCSECLDAEDEAAEQAAEDLRVEQRARELVAKGARA